MSCSLRAFRNQVRKHGTLVIQHFLHCNLLLKSPGISSGERKLRSAQRKLKRQGTARGRECGMSHDVAGFRVGRTERKRLTGGSDAPSPVLSRAPCCILGEAGSDGGRVEQASKKRRG